MTIILELDFFFTTRTPSPLKNLKKISCKSHSSLLKLKKRAHESEWIQMDYLPGYFTCTS